jgi:uncharacterized membrane protein YsdA (DUF1294 family)
MVTPIKALLWLIVVNGITVLAFWSDKRRAQSGAYRISESHLLTLALLGGSPAALFARHRFRHKTRKQPFSTYLILICLAQLAGAILFGLSRS